MARWSSIAGRVAEVSPEKRSQEVSWPHPPVLAALLAAAVAGAGAGRRRGEQALLRTRGFLPRRVATLASVEAGAQGAALPVHTPVGTVASNR